MNLLWSFRLFAMDLRCEIGGSPKKRTQTPFFMRLTCGRPWTLQAVQKLGQHSFGCFFEGMGCCSRLCISTVKSCSPTSPDLPCESFAAGQWVLGFPSPVDLLQQSRSHCFQLCKRTPGGGEEENRKWQQEMSICKKHLKISLCCDLQDFDGQLGKCNKDLMTLRAQRNL